MEVHVELQVQVGEHVFASKAVIELMDGFDPNYVPTVVTELVRQLADASMQNGGAESIRRGIEAERS